MRKPVIKIVVILILLLIHCDSFCQTRHNLKDYSASELKFLMRNGFSHESYNWQNDQVNLLIKKVMRERRSANMIIGVGVVTGVLIMAVGAKNAYQGLTVGSQGAANVQSPPLGLIIAGIGVLTINLNIGISKKHRAKNKIWQAKSLLRIKPVRSRYNDFFKKVD